MSMNAKQLIEKVLKGANPKRVVEAYGWYDMKTHWFGNTTFKKARAIIKALKLKRGVGGLKTPRGETAPWGDGEWPNATISLRPSSEGLAHSSWSPEDARWTIKVKKGSPALDTVQRILGQQIG